MRTSLIIAALLVAVPAHAKPWMCVLLPKQCIEPVAAPVEIVPVPAPWPAAAPRPPEPAPPPAPAPTVAKPAAKPLPRVIRPKYKPAPAKARRAAKMADWCKHVPSIATESQVIKGAAGYGLTVSHAQAAACLKSKRT